MSNIIEKILIQNSKIERDVNRIGTLDDGEVCSNVIEKLRTFIEHIAMLHYIKENSLSEEIVYDNIKTAISFAKNDKNIDFLAKQHKYLQACASHYVIDEMTAPRLIQKYCPYLFKVKKWIKRKYNIDILSNLDKLSSINATKILDYYKPILKLVYNLDYIHNPAPKERYYVHSCFPILVSEKLIYEVTLGVASDYASKFNRFIVFSNEEIKTNYSIRCEIVEKEITVSDLTTKIKIVQDWATSIRPCEFENLGTIFGLSEKVSSNSIEYGNLMLYLNNTKQTILDIISSTEYRKIKNKILLNANGNHIFKILDKCHELISSWYSEKNLIKYLSYNLNNKIIKEQRSLFENNIGLFINSGVYPFCDNPFAMSLVDHNPNIIDLIDVFGDPADDQLVYRKIRNATEINNVIYHKLDELFTEERKTIEERINSINKRLSWSQKSQIKNCGDYFYIAEYEDSSVEIINKLMQLSKQGIPGYTQFASLQIQNGISIESDEKRAIALNLFSDTKVACIYGPAGTGKSFMAKIISQIYSLSKKIYISTTNTAVNNIFHKVGGNINDFMTIKKYLSKNITCDILFIDECSMVSNSDMLEILNKGNFKCLILLGDIIQIESIKFGNWYKLANYLLSKKCINELSTMYRTSSEELKLLWKSVREKDDVISELLSQYRMIKEVDDKTLFDYHDSQIVLALNYNGLYGINNLNSIMQEKNKNTKVKIGTYTYKVDDPILFTENNQYNSVLYNNLSGKIVKLSESNDKVIFILSVNTVINVMDISIYQEIKVLEIKNNSSILEISVPKKFDSDNDEKKSNLPPFQIAYAVSIHKSQGLEFENVKVVISDDVDHEITHNIFYTAVTRTYKNLSIYWSNNTQSKVLKNILNKQTFTDLGILSTKFNLKIRK